MRYRRTLKTEVQEPCPNCKYPLDPAAALHRIHELEELVEHLANQIEFLGGNVQEQSETATIKGESIKDVDTLDRRIRELIRMFHPDKNRDPLDPGRVTRELNKLRTSLKNG